MNNEARTYLEEKQEVTIIPTPDLPDWAVLTVGEIDDLEQWFDNRSGPGNVYLLWYVPTAEQAQTYVDEMKRIAPKATAPSIVCLDTQGDYCTVYATEKEARADLKAFVSKGRPERVRTPLDA
jgi:hypothetical protein